MNILRLRLPFDLGSRLQALTYPFLLAALLSGCAVNRHDNKYTSSIRMPEKQLADFLLTRCDDLWQLRGQDSDNTSPDNNPLYLLRTLECSEQLTPTQASSQAAGIVGNDWADTLYRAILLAKVKMTAEQRQNYLTTLNAAERHIPAQLWSLFNLWRNNQRMQLTLLQERVRYHKFQQITDSELDTLRQQLKTTREQLGQTTRKLESLTDIERQLSSRKVAGSFTQPGRHTSNNEKNTVVQAPVAETAPMADDKPTITNEQAAP